METKYSNFTNWSQKESTIYFSNNFIFSCIIQYYQFKTARSNEEWIHIKDWYLANILKKLKNSWIEQIVAITISNKGIYNWFQKITSNEMIYKMLILQGNTPNCYMYCKRQLTTFTRNKNKQRDEKNRIKQ